MIKKHTLSNFLLILTALYMSIDIYLYIITLFIFLFVTPIKKQIKIHLKNILLFIIVISFLLLFLLNSSQMTLPNPLLTIMRYCLLVFFIFYLSNFYEIDKLIYFFFWLCIFTLLSAFIISGYSIYLNISSFRTLGYGHVYNPLHDVYVPSPKIALQIALCISYITLFFNTKKIIKIILYIISFATILYLQSRASFLILLLLALSPILYLIKNKRLLIIVLLFLSITLVLIIFKEPNIVIDKYRITNSILESKRLLHWFDGINKLIEYPFGGFYIDKNIENVNYFHNIFLDSARIYGWFSIILLIGMFIIYFSTLIINNNKIYFLLFLINFMILNQDVIIEGNFLLFLIFYIASTILINQEYE